MNEKKLNGWNNNLTPFDGVGGKPGYHEKIPTMTPEQQKAKEIVEKHRKIILSKVVVGNKGSGEILAAKACAIEEVKAVIADNQNTYKILLENHAQRSVPPIIKREIELQNILTEIEKL